MWHDDLAVMRRTVSASVQVEAAGAVRSLDALLAVMALGVTRVSATATAAILDEFVARKETTDAAGVAAAAAKRAG